MGTACSLHPAALWYHTDHSLPTTVLTTHPPPHGHSPHTHQHRHTVSQRVLQQQRSAWCACRSKWRQILTNQVTKQQLQAPGHLQAVDLHLILRSIEVSAVPFVRAICLNTVFASADRPCRVLDHSGLCSWHCAACVMNHLGESIRTMTSSPISRHGSTAVIAVSVRQSGTASAMGVSSTPARHQMPAQCNFETVKPSAYVAPASYTRYTLIRSSNRFSRKYVCAYPPVLRHSADCVRAHRYKLPGLQRLRQPVP